MTNRLISIVFLIISVQYGYNQDYKHLDVKVFILAGQSNMDGCGIGEELPKKYQSSPENVIVWDNTNNNWVELGETSFSKSREKQFGPEISFSHALANAFPNQTIAIIKTSAGGTKLYNHWFPDSAMYQRCFQNVDKACLNLIKTNQTFEIIGLLWMQGESDSETPEMANAYEKNLNILFANVRKRTQNPELPIVMGRISSKLLKKTPWIFDYTKLVQKAQDKVASDDSHVHIINTDRLSTLWDNTHFDTKAQLKLGKRMSRLMLKEIIR